MAIRNRTFTVPAGTVLRDGFVVPDTVRVTIPYDDAETTRGAAQKRAGQLAVDQLATRYGRDRKAIGGFSGVQKATAQVQRATPTRGKGKGAPAAPRARGGRKPVDFTYKTRKANGRTYLQITNEPGDIFQAIRALIQRGLKQKGAQAAAVVGEALSNPDCDGPKRRPGSGPGRKLDIADVPDEEDEDAEPPEDETFYWYQTAAFRSLSAFDAMYPSEQAFERKMCLLLFESRGWAVIVSKGGQR